MVGVLFGFHLNTNQKEVHILRKDWVSLLCARLGGGGVQIPFETNRANKQCS